jgi:hypothetical protein
VFDEWTAHRVVLAELLREEPLWLRLVRVYAAIYAARSYGSAPPDPDELERISEQLLATRHELGRRIDAAKLFRRV